MRVHGADVARWRGLDRKELHPALRAASRLIADDVGMHRTREDSPLGYLELHLRDEGERLVRGCIQQRRGSLALGRHVGVGSRHGELLRERGLGGLIAFDGDRRQPIRASRRAVLEHVLARLLEEHVYYEPLGRRQENLFDEALVLVVAAVSADELHASTWQRHVEDASVGSVGEVEAHDLTTLRGEVVQFVSSPTLPTLASST